MSDQEDAKAYRLRHAQKLIDDMLADLRRFEEKYKGMANIEACAPLFREIWRFLDAHREQG